MSNTATLKDNHLHITYDYYDYGHKTGRKIIPIEDIKCIKAKVGVRGGMHLWSIKGYHPEYSDSTSDRDKDIFTGDRKDATLIEQITSLLPNCKYYEKVESGGAGW